MRRSRILKLGGAIIGLAMTAWLLRACYGVFVDKDDQPAADRIVVALAAYSDAKGRYLPALPAPRRFGAIGYAPLEGGRGCLLGYFTHRDYLEEYDCRAKAWTSAEYNDSRLIKAAPTQWLRGPT